MSVVIRFQPTGRKRQRFFRFAVQDKRTAVSRKAIAYLGFYDPRTKAGKVDAEAFADWVKKGALPSETVAAAVARIGAAPKKAAAAEKKAEKPADEKPVKKAPAKKPAAKKSPTKKAA